MDAFHFLRPAWFLALLPWLALSWRLWRRDRDSGAWRAVCDPALLPFVIEGGAPGRRGLAAVVLGLAGTLAIIALAGPTWRELPLPVYRQQEALVIVLDLSRSMDATDIEPSRLVRARLKIRDLLQRRSDGRSALVVFAGDAFPVTPLTDDVNTIDALVPALTTGMMPLPGTRTDRALDAAAALLEQAGARGGRVLLITDAAGARAPDAAVARLRQAGHRLSVIGVGTPEGATIPAGGGKVVRNAAGEIVVSRLDEGALRALADAGDGQYVRLSVDDADLDAVLGDGGGPVPWLTVSDVPGLTSDRWREEGPWLLLALLPIASLAFRRGLLVLALVSVMPLPRPAQALDWTSPWHNGDQRGARAFDAQDYAGAAHAFSNPRWKAAALYRAGLYEQAAAVLAPLGDTPALYNRGNALARLGRFDEAMALYEQVLRTDPEHEDARHNLDLLRALDSRAPPPDGERDGDDSRAPAPKDPDGSSSGQRNEGGDAPPQGAGDEPGDDRADDPSASPGGSQQAAEPPPGQDPGEASSAAGDTPPSESDDARGRPPASGDDVSGSTADSERAMTQWLRQIEDDPAGLLRRKFRYQYGRRASGAAADGEPW